jgi:hypothetical protein
VRPSTPKQVLANRESTARQYAFAADAVAAGWPRERVLTIDDDLGKSARTAEGRSGFQRLVGEVTLGHVGMVLGLEMSRSGHAKPQAAPGNVAAPDQADWKPLSLEIAEQPNCSRSSATRRVARRSHGRGGSWATVQDPDRIN